MCNGKASLNLSKHMEVASTDTECSVNDVNWDQQISRNSYCIHNNPVLQAFYRTCTLFFF